MSSQRAGTGHKTLNRLVEESTQSDGPDETDKTSRFPYGHLISIKNDQTNMTNDYLLTRRIGRGGFSEVRLGKLRSDRSRRFAIKLVDLKRPKAQRIGRQTHCEIDILRRFEDSEFVVQLLDFKIVEDDCIFMVLELGGQSLDSLHKKSRGQTDNSPLTIKIRAHQCVKCVEACHSLNVLHCDVKPNNFIFTGNKLKLIDFGCATAIGPMDEAASKSLDVWSLGCVLFWLLTGEKIWKESKRDLKCIITTRDLNFAVVRDPDARLLLESIFDRDRHQRPSCSKVLKSTYFTRTDDAKSPKRRSRTKSKSKSTAHPSY
ncbi:Protein kinase domain-containing protein [Aphelenchoides besseyi]|nr:Protein kinase domain-containing protein [Aphelenchoides besseyi]KAI6210077.1 Protein kinase domain-containing protein [Aphelenchoides besseyi]